MSDKRIILKLAQNEIWIVLFATRHVIGCAVPALWVIWRTRFVDRANMCQTRKKVLISVDNLFCKMFVCFPVLYNIILFHHSLKTVLQMPSTIESSGSGQWCFLFCSDFYMSCKSSSVSLYLYHNKYLRMIFIFTFLTRI